MKRLDVEIEIAKIDEKLRVRTDEVCVADGCIYEDAEINDLESKKRRLKAQAGKDIIEAIRDFSDDELIAFIHSVVKLNFDRKKKTTSNDRRFAVTLPIEDALMDGNSSEIEIMSEAEVMKLAKKPDVESILDELTETNREFDYIGSWVEIK